VVVVVEDGDVVDIEVADVGVAAMLGALTRAADSVPGVVTSLARAVAHAAATSAVRVTATTRRDLMSTE
jgi:hypothetical protein